MSFRVNLFSIAVLITIVFVVLKFLNVISWSWLVVFSPLLVAVILFILSLFSFIVMIVIGIVLIIVIALVVR